MHVPEGKYCRVKMMWISPGGQMYTKNLKTAAQKMKKTQPEKNKKENQNQIMMTEWIKRTWRREKVWKRNPHAVDLCKSPCCPMI